MQVRLNGRFSPSLNFSELLSSPRACSNHQLLLDFFGKRDHQAQIEAWGFVMAVHPKELTAAERLGEIAEILALGLMRLKSRKSSQISARIGDSSLDCVAHQGGHADVLSHGGSK
jgi:hypothetical protein